MLARPARAAPRHRRARPLPKVKSSPVTTPAAPIRSASTSATKSSASVAASAAPKSEHQHRVGAGMGEQPLALVERGQAERRHVGLEEFDRVRVEGGDDHRPPLVETARDRPPDHRLVAEVEAVEIAERDDAPLEAFGDSAVEGQPLHRARALSAAGGAAISAGNVGFLRSSVGRERRPAAKSRSNLVVSAKIVNIRAFTKGAALDSSLSHSYLQLIPIHRFPAAHLCARRFFVWRRAF